MRAARLPAALSDRLGEEGSAALVELFDANRRACADEVMMQCAERFERRLIEETSKLRIEMHAGFAAVRHEMADSRFELLKWAFVFWVGQLVGVAGVVGLLLRTMPAR